MVPPLESNITTDGDEAPRNKTAIRPLPSVNGIAVLAEILDANSMDQFEAAVPEVMEEIGMDSTTADPSSTLP